MKNCICCNSSSDDAAATCPRCGEASWSLGTIEVVAGPIIGARDTRTTPLDAAPQQGDVVVHGKKRSKK